MTAWGDLDVRARGLGTRLLGRARLEALARAGDLSSLALELERAGYERITPIERAVRRTVAAHMRTLERWAGDRARALAVVFEEQDVRDLRALFRGALAGAPAESRHAATIPTASLPERALGELARLGTAGEIATVLLLIRHPYASAIASEARREAPRVFVLETLLYRRFAERALAGARDRALGDFVEETIDVQNALAAIELAHQGEGTEPRDCFVEGGARVRWPDFEAASKSDAIGAARGLAARFGKGELATALSRAPAALDDAVLAAKITEQARAARRDPLGPAALLHYVHRLRAEAADVRRIAAGVALGAPADVLISQLVTP